MKVKLLLPALLLATPLAFAQGGPVGQPPMDHSSHHMGGDRHEDMGGPGFEHGMWWKSPEVATKIGLTPDQTKKIDDIVMQSRVQLIDLHASLEKEQLMMEPLMNANPVDQSKASAAIDKIADTRATLEKTNAKMLLSIRGVLTADQWTRLQASHHEHEMHHGPEGRGMSGEHRGPGAPQGNQQKPGTPPPPPAQ